jgi:hypothetical protein
MSEALAAVEGLNGERLSRGIPYPGLRPYEELDADWFFGRDQEVNDLLRRLRRAHFLAVVGPSGCGKSSLIKAGVLRALHDGFLGVEWRIAEMRPGAGPINQLTAALDRALSLSGEQIAGDLTSDVGIVAAARRANGESGAHLLVFVDQFEELFRFATDGGTAGRDETKRFLKLLLSASITDEVPIYVVLTMRLEWLGECATYIGLAEAINEGIYLVPQMTRQQFCQAIVCPVERAGGSITAGLVDRLLNDLDGQTDQLPVLQHALMLMWRKDTRRNVIDLNDYRDVGELSSCLSRDAEKTYKELSDEQRQGAEMLFRVITDITHDNRRIRRRSLRDILQLTGRTRNQLEPVIEAFARTGRNFLTKSPGSLSEQSVIDISHEALLRQWELLRGWLDDEAAKRRTLRTLEDTASEWRRQRDHGSYLYRGFRLEEAEKLEGRLSELGVEFLTASRRSKRRRQLVAWSSIIPAVLALVLGLGYKVRADAAAHTQAAVQAAEKVAKDQLVKQQEESSRRIEQERIQTAKAYTCLVKEECAAETLNSIKATVNKIGKTLLYVQIVNESQRAFAKQLQEKLGSDYLVLGVERVRAVPSRSEVRYFHRSDSEQAEALNNRVSTLLGMQDSRAKLIPGYGEKVPPKQFEIWMSAKAGSDSGTPEQR